MWTKEEVGKLREYHTAMMTVSEIAEKMQKKKSDIRRKLVEMGYLPIEKKPEPEPSEFLKGFKPVTMPRREYTKITPETEKRVCELREQCFAVTQIADKLQIGSPQTVVNILKRNGYPTERGKFHKENKEDKPMKAAQINEDFEQAVSEMIAETNAKEKEPASVGADASSEVRNSPNISTSNDTTKPSKSQAVSGITHGNQFSKTTCKIILGSIRHSNIIFERAALDLFLALKLLMKLIAAFLNIFRHC